jgi:predicted  nucleic acid-binding Zn-ribbon protein
MEPSAEGASSSALARLATLVRLQALDRERDGKREFTDGLPRILAARQQAVNALESKVAASTEAVMHAKSTARQRELELKSKTAEIQKLELQLNTAKTNQEYQALTQHIQRLREATGREEEDTLGLYDDITRLEAALVKEKEALAQAQKEFAAYQEACERDREATLLEIGQTDGVRTEYLAKLPRDVVETYERLRAGNGGVAVCALDVRTCSGCGMMLTLNDQAKVLGGRELVPCRACGRILYDKTAIASLRT